MAPTSGQRFAYREKFHSLYRADFQLWFSSLARALHPAGDFQPIRLTSGDGALDGIVISEHLAYQVFAPPRLNELRDGEVAAKIRADFAKAHSTMGGKLQAWRFVHNHPEAAVGKLTAAAINDLVTANPGIEFKILDIHSLWDLLVSNLSDESFGQLFPNASVPSLHQLRSPPADFTGRGAELLDLQAALETEGTTLLCIRGMGGVGKTALALKLAESLKPRYPDAQIYLDLKGVSAGPLLPEKAMANVIWAFYPEARLPANDDEVASLYRSVLHGRRVLLLLDNASGRAQVEPLTPPAGSFLLMTSQFRFHLPGLRGMDLAELPMQDSRELLLRIERRIGDQAGRIAEICAGLPFALRSAAGTLAARSDLIPARYAEQLAREKERCGLVEASMSLPYNLLSEESATRWRTLAVFPDDFDISAASYVWDLDQEEAEAVLGDLVIRSLLQGSEGRYRLQDLARVFAGNRLLPEERSRATIRHSGYYLGAAAESAEAFLRGEEVDALRAFDSEWSNIQAGFWNAAQPDQAAETVTELAVLYPIACQPFFSLRLHHQEALRWLNIALPLAHELGDQVNTATLLNTMGLVLRGIGKHDDARVRFEEALAATSGLVNEELEGTILGNLGHELLFLGDLERARVVLDKAYSMARGSGDRHGETVALAGLERLYSELQDFPRALDFALQWLAASRQSRQRQSEGEALGNMGITYMHLGEPQNAITCFEADLCIARDLGDRRGEASAIGNLGWAYALSGDLKKAIAFLEMRISISRDLGDVRGEAESSWSLGWVYEGLGDLARAVELLQVRSDYQHAINHPGAVETDAEILALRARISDAQSP
jgi:tetratricopeptide (TPR) repeat protein